MLSLRVARSLLEQASTSGAGLAQEAVKASAVGLRAYHQNVRLL